MKKLWLYTEERPKAEVLLRLVNRFASDRGFSVEVGEKIRIIPIMKDGLFTFVYRVTGISCAEVEEILVSTVSGNSSFADYIVFYSENQPTPDDTPLYIIEETKTDDKESRNTGVYQRCSKFVYADFFFPDVTKIMMYTLKIKQKDTPTLTYIFGTKMLKTLGVEIDGKTLEEGVYEPFTTVDEMIALKNQMPDPRNGVPVKLNKIGGVITISAKLEKAGRLSHDPNIGMTTIMAACLRKLGWTGDIVITQHGLPDQKSIGKTNKFIQIANKLNIKLEGLTIPASTLANDYWKMESNQEKLGTIFVSILCEEFSNSIAIYENHGGCERGYFISNFDESLEREHLVIPKYVDRDKYKAGDKTAIVYIPDVVIFDRDKNLVINGEGKTYANRVQGYEEIENFDFFEENYIKQYYPEAAIQRTLVLYGSKEDTLDDNRIGILLNEDGKVILGTDVPETIKEAWKKLIST